MKALLSRANARVGLSAAMTLIAVAMIIVMATAGQATAVDPGVAETVVATVDVSPSPETSSEAEDAGGDDEGGAYQSTNRYAQAALNGVIFGLLLALASVGLSLIYGTTGLSNFAHGEQVTLGAVLTYWLATKQEVSLPLIPADFSIGLPLWLAALIAISLAGGTGWLQDRFLWSRLRKRKIGLVQQMIVSIGLSLALLNFLQWWIGGEPQRLTTAIDERRVYGPVAIGNFTFLYITVALIALGGVGYFLLRTRLGRATRAVSDNPALAAASGIRVETVVRLVWIMAASLAATGGILLALYENGTRFDVGARLLLLMFAAVTLGGLGHAFGALVGSLVIGVVSEMSSLWLGADLKIATALAILILVLLVRPQGILGKAERVG